ncbi:MAG TPA: CRISPR-associated protein Cas5, partial [Candidatus Ozemobacteraceae bacterium]|nr:CRISPR-associated protein Cas5 [Candidatus Ozemobacteraceae bacterium]
MKLTRFKLSGRIGHYLRAEANASAPSYPVPPRTALVGLVGAVLGLEKDRPQVVLQTAGVAVSGVLPQTHWHKAKLRKDPPENLPWTIRSNQKTDKQTKEERTGLVTQEWLVNPIYTVWVHLPESFHGQFEERLRESRWHFTPCLGLSEMLADLV